MNERRGTGPAPIAGMIDRLTRASLGRRGFAEAAIISDWPAIVGEAVARSSTPMKIVYPNGERGDGTLYIRVAPGGIALQLQHLQPVVIQRINAYFGWSAVAKVVISQGPLPPRRQRPQPPPPPKVDEAELAAHLRPVDSPALREALAGLGRYVLGKKER